MNIRSFMTLAGALTLALGIAVYAADDKKVTEEKTEVAQEETTAVSPRLGNQTHCPVMGGEIDSTVFTDIQGHRVYHCCPGCSPKLVANPDKYFEKASESGVRFENNQSVCPVSNEPLEKEIFVDFEGRRVFVCCDKCVKMFEKDPARYITLLTSASAEDKSENKPAKPASDGHSHDNGHSHNH